MADYAYEREINISPVILLQNMNMENYQALSFSLLFRIKYPHI